MPKPSRSRVRKFLLVAGGVFACIIIGFLVFVNRFLEPMLKDRLHTLIIQGSDSLYTYTLGKLNANFFGGNVEVENLQIRVDSNRYEQLRARNALPALTMQLSLGRGNIKGVGIIALLFNKEIKIREILSKDANLKLSRHVTPKDSLPPNHLPLWKAMEPKIKSIEIGRISLQGVKMNYKNADTSELKLEFEGCDAAFDDIRIDSTAALDTARVGFTRSINLRFEEVKFRTKDSVYKFKADTVTYSSRDKLLEIRDFKFQPTLKKEAFYEGRTQQQTMYVIKFDRIRFTNLYLDHFIRTNRIDADSAVFDSADVKIYTDKSLLPQYDSKIGKYPHQILLKAPTLINIRHLLCTNGQLEYTEKNEETALEGTLLFGNLQLLAANLTNDSALIQQNPVFSAQLKGNMLGGSPVELNVKFFLDSVNGSYDASGFVKNVTAAQMNQVAVPLANVRINSGNIEAVEFRVRGEDYGAVSDVRMRYSGLSLTISKTDEETGRTTARKFINSLLNKFILWPDNPSGGSERTTSGHQVARLTTQTFFGMLWKAIFAGMQDVMMKSGRYS